MRHRLTDHTLHYINTQELLTMLYTHCDRTPFENPKTQRVIDAAEGYIFFELWRDALDELCLNVPKEDRESSKVIHVETELFLRLKKWHFAEQSAALGESLYPEQILFGVQRAIALRRLGNNVGASLLLNSFPDAVKRTGVLHYNTACYEAILGCSTRARRCVLLALSVNPNLGKMIRQDADFKKLFT